MTPSAIEDFSPTQIALKLGRHQTSVWRTIRRIGMQPHRETPAGYQYFTEEQIKTIRASMRSFNTPTAEKATD